MRIMCRQRSIDTLYFMYVATMHCESSNMTSHILNATKIEGLQYKLNVNK